MREEIMNKFRLAVLLNAFNEEMIYKASLFWRLVRSRRVVDDRNVLTKRLATNGRVFLWQCGA